MAAKAASVPSSTAYSRWSGDDQGGKSVTVSSFMCYFRMQAWEAGWGSNVKLCIQVLGLGISKG